MNDLISTIEAMFTLKHNSMRFLAPAATGLILMSCLAAPLTGCAKNKDFKLPQNGGDDLRKAMDFASQGETLRKQGKYADAAQQYQKSIEVKNDIGAVWVNYGVCLMELQDFIPARDAFMRAANLLPSDPTPYENLGTLYINRGYADKALEYYELSLQSNPNWLPSLRGVIIAARDLRIYNQKGLDYIDTAIMIEKDPKYLRLMQAERFRMQDALKNRPVANAE